MLPKPGSQDSSLEVGHPALWEETRQTEKAEDKGEGGCCGSGVDSMEFQFRTWWAF